MTGSEILFYLQAVILIGCIGMCLYAAAEKTRGWPAARQYSVRNMLTALLGMASLSSLVTGRWTLVPVSLFMVLPMLRAIFDPVRGVVTDEQRTDIVKAMTRADALRLLELDEDEVSEAAVAAAYARLYKLVAGRKGGIHPYYAARLETARDFLLKNRD